MLGVGRSHAGFGRAVGSRNDLHGLPRDAGPAHHAVRLRKFEMIDGGLPAHHRFAEAEVRVDDDLAEVAAYRIETEADPGDLARHHHLHDDGHRGPRVVEPLLLAVGNGAFVPERQEAGLDFGENRVGPGDSEKRVVLAGEDRVGQILQGRRRPDGKRLTGGKARECGPHLGDQRVRQRQRGEAGAQRFALGPPARRIGHRQRAHADGEAVGRGDKSAVGRGGDHKTRWHREATLREQRKIRPLAAAAVGRVGGGIREVEEVTHGLGAENRRLTNQSAAADRAKPATRSTK